MKDEIKKAEKKQLSNLSRNQVLNRLLKRLYSNDMTMTDEEKELLLSSAIVIFNIYNSDRRYRSYFKLAYHIVLKYSLLYGDYKPLYDISAQIGFFPICNAINRNQLYKLVNINEVINHKMIEIKYRNRRESYIETLEQKVSKSNILKDIESNDIAFIAPTSFGKSSIIVDLILKYNFRKIGIIVPSKSLLIQTYRTIKSEIGNYKLILHDEMYNNEERFIGILTQERATRLLKHGVAFDVLFIDEAHNIFKYSRNDQRGIILSRLIKLNKKKNDGHKVVYLSPLVDKAKNLKLNSTHVIKPSRIEHNIKSEEYYLFENTQSFMYNKFTDEFYKKSNKESYFEYIINKSHNKNFIYHYKPKKIEELSLELSNHLPDIVLTEDIKNVLNTLKEEVHDSFYVNNLIKKGILYIHGMIPNLVKEYLEYQFKNINGIKYIIANTVILEGINLPIDNMFIACTDYLKRNDLVNLIGRVNRLNNVFTDNKLSKLMPQIHFINHSYYQGDHSIRNKMKLLRESTIKDSIRNPIMTEYNIDEQNFVDTEKETKEEKKERRVKKDKEILDFTDYIISDIDNDNLANKLKRYFIENSFEKYFFSIDDIVKIICERIGNTKKDKRFFNRDIISKIFLLFIKDTEKLICDFELERLKYKAARNYYLNYLKYNQKQTIKQNIRSTLNYFERKKVSNDPYLFIGSSYGDEKRFSDRYNNDKYKDSVYIDLSKPESSKLVNIAIVKLKIEENFVNYKLNKFIVFLYDFNLISEDEYYMYIYGTSNHDLIKFAKFGLNLNCIKKMIDDKQITNINLDTIGNLVGNENFYLYLDTLPELLKFELKKYL